MAEDIINDLRLLVEEYQLSIHIGRHLNVHRLGREIRNKLIEICESEHREDIEDSLNDTEEPNLNQRLLVRITDIVCERIRHQSCIASAYGHVVDFVRIQDSVCLSRLVKAIPWTNEYTHDKPVEFHELSRVLRKSIYIQSHNDNHKQDVQKHEIRLDKSNIIRIPSVSFPRFIIDLAEVKTNSSNQRQPLETKAKLKDLLCVLESRFEDSESERAASHLVRAKWFKSFVDNQLDQPKLYPVDRFTLLIALWIVATECQHRQLEGIISDLVGQIYHEEANSCCDEDLFQLRQVGSFWLSYYKYHRESWCSSENVDIEDSRSISESDSDSDIGPNSDENEAVRSESANFRRKLRSIIDSELLGGVECPTCGYEPVDLLEPVNRGTLDCLGCSSGPTFHCAISYKRLPLVSLDSLLTDRENLKRFVVISYNEIVRRLYSSIRSKNGDLSIKQRITERIDINENFERLTMIRTSTEEHEVEDDNQDNIPVRIVDSYMSSVISRKDQRFSYRNSRPKSQSRSVEILKYVRDNSELRRVEELPIFSADILILSERGSGSFVIRLSLSKYPLDLYGCFTRSSKTKLLLGCNQLFEYLELVRSGCHQSHTNNYQCPHCSLPLTKVESLQENHWVESTTVK